MRKRVLFLIMLAGCLSFACAVKRVNQAKEEPPPASPAAPHAAGPGSPKAATSTAHFSPSDVKVALARVYEDVVSLSAAHNQPFVIGDFNGDASKDICVIVNPDKSRLQDINSEVANWMVKDPLAGAAVLDPNVEISHAKAAAHPLISERDRTLIAVIHGYGPEGWQSVEARQAYLLKNAVGDNMETRLKKSIMRANTGKSPFPYILGDVISQTLNGEPGFLYYDGAKYVWYGVRSYEGTIARRPGH